MNIFSKLQLFCSVIKGELRTCRGRGLLTDLLNSPPRLRWFHVVSGERSGSERADSGRGGGSAQGHTHGRGCGTAGSTPGGCLPAPRSGTFVPASPFLHRNSLSILTRSLKHLCVCCASRVLLIPAVSMQIDSLTLSVARSVLSEEICGAQSLSSLLLHLPPILPL